MPDFYELALSKSCRAIYYLFLSIRYPCEETEAIYLRPYSLYVFYLLPN